MSNIIERQEARIAKLETRTSAIIERQEELIVELERRVELGNRRITELQTTGTNFVNEGRMLRAQLSAAKAVMRVGFIERPMSSLYPPDGSACMDLVRLYERIELLEKDAWTQTTQAAKEFVKEAHAMMVKDDTWQPVDFIEAWHKKFRDLLGD